jgi:hypothetical protein
VFGAEGAVGEEGLDVKGNLGALHVGYVHGCPLNIVVAGGITGNVNVISYPVATFYAN